MILEVRDISVSYGGIRALTGVSLEVGEGEIVSIIGANGAGKSTMLRTISGLLKPDRGSIYLENREITNEPDILTNVLRQFAKTLWLNHKTTVEKATAGDSDDNGDYSEYCFDYIYEHGVYPP